MKMTLLCLIKHQKSERRVKGLDKLLQSHMVVALIIVSLFLLWVFFPPQSDGGRTPVFFFFFKKTNKKNTPLMSSAPSARFTHRGKCQRNCFDLPAARSGFTGDQTELCWITGGMRKTSFWGNCPDPVWHFSLKVLRRTCWHLCACTGADVAGQHPGSAAAGHSSHFTALWRPGCPWLHLQGRLIRSGKLIWHWKIERLLWNFGKNQDYLNAVAAPVPRFTWFHLLSSYSGYTHLRSAQEIQV